ncbi:GGDEF domain-containing protein [Vibrio parahaemolyticus]|uniref:GGDEF domain-containing protein n=1 Tax=Vibrio parahaemolyticus TaxID=670 RepID=UPI00293FB07D|nr:diguanylate cyclase [Vibrio parahaemolyticus]MDV5082318.1 diguanylate cyclase [Vibrio parahaemolyticus]
MLEKRNNEPNLNVTLNKGSEHTKSPEFPRDIDETTLIDYLKLSTEYSADEVFWMEPDSNIIYVNQSACLKLGYERHELIGMKVWEWDPLFPKEVWPTFWKELKSLKSIDFETQHKGKDGVVFPVRIKGHYINVHNKELLFAYVTDITQAKRHEAELESYNERLEEEVNKKTRQLKAEKDSVQKHAKNLELLIKRQNETVEKNNYLQQQLYNEAHTDALTGLYNRRHLDEICAKEVSRADRYNTPLSAIMIDIDHFKLVNDMLGHQVGDEILKELANLLSNRMRESDVLARWGGEEFVILLPNTATSGCESIAEELRELVACHEFGDVGQIKVSIGVTKHNNGEPSTMLIHNVDLALYQAKNKGRNRVETYTYGVESD